MLVFFSPPSLLHLSSTILLPRPAKAPREIRKVKSQNNMQVAAIRVLSFGIAVCDIDACKALNGHRGANQMGIPLSIAPFVDQNFALII